MPDTYRIIVEGYGKATGQTSLVRQLTYEKVEKNIAANFFPFRLDKKVNIWILPENDPSKVAFRQRAELYLYCIDLSKDITEDDLKNIQSNLNHIKKHIPGIILIGTKSDLAKDRNKKELESRLQQKLGPIPYLTTTICKDEVKGIIELEKLIQKQLNTDFNSLIDKFREDADFLFMNTDFNSLINKFRKDADFLLTGHKLKELDAAIDKLKIETKNGNFKKAFPEFFSTACDITDNNDSLLSNLICAAFVVCISALVTALGFAIGCALCSWAAPLALAGLIGFSIFEFNILAGTTFALISGTSVGLALGFTFFHNPNKDLYTSLTNMKTIAEDQPNEVIAAPEPSEADCAYANN